MDQQHTTQAVPKNDSEHVIHIKELYFGQQTRNKEKVNTGLQQFSKQY
jgi:hypothetical protein